MIATGFAAIGPPNPAAVPKDAAAVILVRTDDAGNTPQVFWARRSERMAFLGGFYAFPGGQRDAEDAETRVENCADTERAAMISCAARELFEETGVLVGMRASVIPRSTVGPIRCSGSYKRKARPSNVAIGPTSMLETKPGG